MKTKKLTIKERVKENQENLQGMGYKELKHWAFDEKMNNRAAFSKFKKALLEINIDYNKLRHEANRVFAEKTIKLYSDAKGSTGKFAICNQDKEVVWFGQFFNLYDFEQSVCEMEAAKKAVWLAKKVAEHHGLKTIKLQLYVDAQWLCCANAVRDGQEKYGRKARVLGYVAQDAGVELDVKWIKGTKNPADYYTTIRGYKKWNEEIKSIKIS